MLKRFLTLHSFSLFFYSTFLLGLFLIKEFKIISNLSLLALFLIAIYYLIQNFKSIRLSNLFPWICFSVPLILHMIHYSYICDYRNKEYYFETLLLKVSFFILPFCIMLLRPIKKDHFLKILYLFFIVCTLYTVGALISYTINFQDINQSYLHSKLIPMPINHIRFSLMVVTAISIGFYLLKQGYSLKYKFEKKLIISFTFILILFLHIHSVRIGLLSFYFIIILFGSSYLIKKNKIKLLCMSLLFILSTPIISYFLIPTFHNKIINTKNDLQSICSEKSANQYSLAGRLVSYKVSYSLLKESPFFGVGIGNLKQKVADRYHRDYPQIEEEMIKLPHNEFLRFATSFGLIGLILFLTSFYYPLFYQKNYQNTFLLIQYIIVSLSFLVEDTLHTIHGLYFSLGFILLPLYYLRKNNKYNQA